ncbi:MAG: hypothetical protein HKN07_07405 [Acidimicrobiia bacterium]|nr:hypothetical protein [Acidimicrobiia bacterium]
MGQKEKARAIIESEYEFLVQTNLDMDGMLDAARRAMSASSATMGRVEEVGLAYTDGDAFASKYVLKGLGGVMEIMQIALEGTPAETGGMYAELKIGDFMFQKGSLGMKPSINGRKVIGKFVEVLRAELAAG